MRSKDLDLVLMAVVCAGNLQAGDFIKNGKSAVKLRIFRKIGSFEARVWVTIKNTRVNTLQNMIYIKKNTKE